MLTKLRTKIRALIEDFSLTDFEEFSYTISNIFTIATENITITQVLINGSPLGSGESYSYSSSTGKITITRASWNTGDKVEVDFSYNQYSDTELDEHIRGALVWMSILGYKEGDLELESTEIVPTPNNKTLDLIALITSILIKPDFVEKRLPNVSVRYPRTMTKEQQIKEIILMTNMGIGVIDTIQWD